MNSIYIRRQRKVYLTSGGTALPLAHLATLQKNLESLGFLCSPALLHRIKTLSPERASTFYRWLVKDLQEMVGAHRVFKPMYPNFPAQVMEMPKAELYLNAVLHYATNRLLSYKPSPRSALIEAVKPEVIDLGSKDEFEQIFTQLVGARTSLSPQDKQDVVWFVSQYRHDIARLMPGDIPFKENLAVVGAQLLRYTSLAGALLVGKIQTATDVLRLAVALSDGDVSLAEATRFGSFAVVNGSKCSLGLTPCMIRRRTCSAGRSNGSASGSGSIRAITPISCPKPTAPFAPRATTNRSKPSIAASNARCLVETLHPR